MPKYCSSTKYRVSYSVQRIEYRTKHSAFPISNTVILCCRPASNLEVTLYSKKSLLYCCGHGKIWCSRYFDSPGSRCFSRYNRDSCAEVFENNRSLVHMCNFRRHSEELETIMLSNIARFLRVVQFVSSNASLFETSSSNDDNCEDGTIVFLPERPKLQIDDLLRLLHAQVYRRSLFVLVPRNLAKWCSIVAPV
eukprot:scaffold1190_cov69-Cylindrotheca_fusiformis.AAC.3